MAETVMAATKIIEADTSITNTSVKINANAITDSTKLFVQLLSSSTSANANIVINSEAKLFADSYIKTHEAFLNNMKVWGKPYFDLYDRILNSYNIPVQLKYLSVIESSLSSTSVSWAGAVGPWQIMSDAAHENGLRTGKYDDRFDYIKSTNAAAHILRQLYERYHNWLLVIAAYNCGIGNVDRAINITHSNNFWKLQYYLPEETRNHVKKFIATHYYFEGGGSMVTLTADEAKNYIKPDAVADTLAAQTAYDHIIISGRYNALTIARNINMDVNAFNQLNPALNNELAKGNAYNLQLPQPQAALFLLKREEILKQSVELLFASGLH